MHTLQSNNLSNGPGHFITFLIPSLLVLHPSALPILFQEEMLDKEATEGQAVTLHCKLSKSAPVEWRKGNKVLKPSEKYKIEQEGPFAELVIQDLDSADAGDYSCVCGNQQTTATLTVNGKKKKRNSQHTFLHSFSPTASDLSALSHFHPCWQIFLSCFSPFSLPHHCFSLSALTSSPLDVLCLNDLWSTGLPLNTIPDPVQLLFKFFFS